MIIVELKIFVNTVFIGITEYMEKLIQIFFIQISQDDIQLGDMIFLFIVGLFILSLVLSALSRIKDYLVSIT